MSGRGPLFDLAALTVNLISGANVSLLYRDKYITPPLGSHLSFGRFTKSIDYSATLDTSHSSDTGIGRLQILVQNRLWKPQIIYTTAPLLNTLSDIRIECIESMHRGRESVYVACVCVK